MVGYKAKDSFDKMVYKSISSFHIFPKIQEKLMFKNLSNYPGNISIRWI